MRKTDLSMKAGLNLLHVSCQLNHRTAAHDLNQMVGEHEGRFYLLDFTTNKVSRLTFGAFRHLSDTWAARAAVAS